MNIVHVLIGGNMNDRAGNLDKAVHFLGQRAGLIAKKSSVYETAPWGEAAQAPFLNQALVLETTLQPLDLLDIILDIEASMGRRRLARNGPRIIDIDILFYDNITYNAARLVIPHPEIQNRRFALVPLAEIDPHLVHPVLGLTITELLRQCPDKLEVSVFSSPAGDSPQSQV